MLHNFPSSVSLSTNSSMSIAIDNSESVPLSGIGIIATTFLSLFDVYYIPCLTMNLAFVGKICDFGNNVYLTPSKCFVQDRTS